MTIEGNHGDMSDDASDNATGGPENRVNAEAAATQRFMHGVLEFIHQDGAELRESRIQDAMQTIRQDDLSEPQAERESRPLAPTQSWMSRRIIPFATLTSVAAIIVVLLVMVPQPSAFAHVDAAIEATRSANSLRYEILNDADEVMGTLDMQGNKLRARIETPDGHDFVMGRDDEGEWSLRRDGSVERRDPRMAAPRWIDLGERTVMFGSLDGMLASLRDDYQVHVAGEERDESGTVRTIVATREARRRRGPNRIEVLIEVETDLVRRLELRWPASPTRSDSRAGRRDRPDGPRHEGPRHEGPRRDGPRNDDSRRERSTTPRGDRPPPPPPRITFVRVDVTPTGTEWFSPPEH